MCNILFKRSPGLYDSLYCKGVVVDASITDEVVVTNNISDFKQPRAELVVPLDTTEKDARQALLKYIK